MNAKHSLYTSRLVLLLAGAVLCVPALRAQDAWDGSRNVAGLATDEPDSKEAEACIFGKFTSGDFRTWSEGKTLWTAGAAAHAQTQLKDLVMTGSFGFMQEEGTQMMGSMFSKPGYYPIDVLEFTPGNKSRQTYDIAGGLAWKNRSRWIPGLSVRFQGINYAKRKDLRHTTYRQELEVTPSVLYRGDGWRLGATFVAGKNSEFVQAEQIGPASADTYYAFLDKGLRYGTYQAWDGSGIHLAEPGVDRLPVYELTQGLALQFSLDGKLFAQLEYLRSHGEAGEKGYTWFRFPRQHWAGQLQYNFYERDICHSIGLDYSWTDTRLNETILEKVTEGGVTTPSILGSNRIFADKTFEMSLVYKMERADGLSLNASLLIDRNNSLSTLMYPYMDLDGGTHLFFSLDSRIPLARRWELKAGFLVGGGAYSEQMSMTTAEPIGVSTTPFRLTDWFETEEEVADALRVQLSLALRYNLARLPLYIEAGFDGTRALEHQLAPGLYRQTSYLQIGYKF